MFKLNNLSLKMYMYLMPNHLKLYFDKQLILTIVLFNFDL